jgi:hypothetical protein
MRGNHHEASSPRMYFTPPFRNHPDKAIAAAYDQFIRERGLHHGIGGAIAYISRHAPAMRDTFSRTHSHKGRTAAA